MDFTQFDSVSASETGAELHLRHAATGELLFDNPEGATVPNDAPCIVVLKGAEAASVREAYRAQQKQKAEAPTEEDDEGRTVLLDDLHEKMVETVLPRVVAFKNVRKGKKNATKKDAEWFFNLNRMNGQEGEVSFVEQAATFSAKRANYLGNDLRG